MAANKPPDRKPDAAVREHVSSRSGRHATFVSGCSSQCALALCRQVWHKTRADTALYAVLQPCTGSVGISTPCTSTQSLQRALALTAPSSMAYALWASHASTY